MRSTPSDSSSEEDDRFFDNVAMLMKVTCKLRKTHDNDVESNKKASSMQEVAGDKPDKQDEGKDEEGKNQNQKWAEKGTTPDFMRIDRVWDPDKYMYVEKPSSENNETGKYGHFAFNVRRLFDWDNKNTGTLLDINSGPLKAALKHIMGEVNGICLDEGSPSIDPNTIFLFLENLRTYMKDIMRGKDIAFQARDLDVLINYLDQDYDETKKSTLSIARKWNNHF